MIDKYTGQKIVSPADKLNLKKMQSKINELGDRYVVDRIPNIPRQKAVGVDFLFGTLKWLRKDIITYVSEENVASLLIGHVDKALSWWPAVFSDDEVPSKFRRSVLAAARRQRNRRAAGGKQNATRRRSPDKHQRKCT